MHSCSFGNFALAHAVTRRRADVPAPVRECCRAPMPCSHPDADGACPTSEQRAAAQNPSRAPLRPEPGAEGHCVQVRIRGPAATCEEIQKNSRAVRSPLPQDPEQSATAPESGAGATASKYGARHRGGGRTLARRRGRRCARDTARARVPACRKDYEEPGRPIDSRSSSSCSKASTDPSTPARSSDRSTSRARPASSTAYTAGRRAERTSRSTPAGISLRCTTCSGAAGSARREDPTPACGASASG